MRNFNSNQGGPCDVHQNRGKQKARTSKLALSQSCSLKSHLLRNDSLATHEKVFLLLLTSGPCLVCKGLPAFRLTANLQQHILHVPKVVLLRLALQLQAACILFLSVTTLRCNELELTSCLASHRDQKIVVSRCKIPVGLDGLPNVTPDSCFIALASNGSKTARECGSSVG